MCGWVGGGGGGEIFNNFLSSLDHSSLRDTSCVINYVHNE